MVSWLANAFSFNLNIMHLKFFSDHGGKALSSFVSCSVLEENEIPKKRSINISTCCWAEFIFWIISFRMINLRRKNLKKPTITFTITFMKLDVFQKFLSPQEKRCAIITYKNDIYKLPHEFPNDLKLRILGNWRISQKCLRLIEW